MSLWMNVSGVPTCTSAWGRQHSAGVSRSFGIEGPPPDAGVLRELVQLLVILFAGDMGAQLAKAFDNLETVLAGSMRPPVTGTDSCTRRRARASRLRRGTDPWTYALQQK
jgi:hypothetical protein